MCEGDSGPMAPILETIYELGYEQTPDYEQLINQFVQALLQLDIAPKVANYDWVRNPSFLTSGATLDSIQNDMPSAESL